MLLTMATGCGGETAAPAPAANPGAGSQNFSAVLHELELELSREVAAASSLTPRVLTGRDARQQVELSRQVNGHEVTVLVQWALRVPGDTNQDGVVNAADLVPLAQHLGEYHDVFGGNPPPLDPNSDGFVSIADLSVIGRHFQEAWDGFRVYRRPIDVPGAEWELLPRAGDPGSPMSVIPADAHQDPDTYRPPTFAYADSNPPPGWFEYQVRPYWAAGDADGEPSVPRSCGTMRFLPGEPSVEVPLKVLLSQEFNVQLTPGLADDQYPVQVELDFGADGVNATHVINAGQEDLSRTYPLQATASGSQAVLIRLFTVQGQELWLKAWLEVREENQAPVIHPPTLEVHDSGVPTTYSLSTRGSYDPDGDRFQLIKSVTGPDGQGIYGGVLSAPGTYTFAVRAIDALGATTRWEQQIYVPAKSTTADGWAVVDLPVGPRVERFLLAEIAGKAALVTHSPGWEGQWTYWSAENSNSPPAQQRGDLADFATPVGTSWDYSLRKLLEVDGRPVAFFYRGGTGVARGYFLSVAADNTGRQWGLPFRIPGGNPDNPPAFGDLTVTDGRLVFCYSYGEHAYLVRSLDGAGAAWSAPQELPGSSNPVLDYAAIDLCNGALTAVFHNTANDGLSVWRSIDTTGGGWSGRQFIPSAFNPRANSFLRTGDGVPPLLVGKLPEPAVIQDGGPPVTYYNQALQRAADLGGTAWQPAVGLDLLPLDSEKGHETYPNASISLAGGKPCAAYYDRDSFRLLFAEAVDAAATQWSIPLVIDDRGFCGEYLHLAEITGQPAIVYTQGHWPDDHSTSVVGPMGPEPTIDGLRYARRRD